jgi:hypothetical protein
MSDDLTRLGDQIIRILYAFKIPKYSTFLPILTLISPSWPHKTGQYDFSVLHRARPYDFSISFAKVLAITGLANFIAGVNKPLSGDLQINTITPP